LQRRRAPESIELFQLTKDTLIDIAKKGKIPNPGGMNKLQLIQAIQAVNVAKEEIAKVISKEEKKQKEAEDYAYLADSGLNAMSIDDLREYADEIKKEVDDNPALDEFKLPQGRPSKIKYIKAIAKWQKQREEQEEEKDVYRDEDLPSLKPKAPKPRRVKGQPSTDETDLTARMPHNTPLFESKYSPIHDEVDKMNKTELIELRKAIKKIDKNFLLTNGEQNVKGFKKSIRDWVSAGNVLPQRREPEARAGVTPEARAGVTPEARAGVTTEARAGVTPEARAGVTPEARAGVTPEARAGVTPARTVSDASKKGLLRPSILTMPGMKGSPSMSEATHLTVPSTSRSDISTPTSSMFAESPAPPRIPQRSASQSQVSTVVPIDENKGDLDLGDVDPDVAAGIYANTATERKSAPSQPPASQPPGSPPPAMSPEFDIGGNGRSSKEFGIDNHTIDKYLSKFGNEYLGCVACDEIPSKIYPKIRPRSRGFFVMNTDPSYKGGCHWVCVFFDARPSGSNSIEYFDSFADPISPRLQQDIKGIAERLDAKTYLKLKENRVKFQSETSDNCGHFCMEFICDRMRGKPFPEASKFNDSVRGEDEVNRWKTQNGFGFLPSFGRIISSLPRPQVPSVIKNAWSGVKERVEQVRQNFFPAKKLPAPVQVLFDKYKNNKVISAQIRREPIFAIIDKVINLISGGKFDEAKREQGYDKMFHLSLIITLDNGQKLLIEKNERINMITSWKDTDKVEYFNVGTIFSQPTLEKFFENTQKAVGDHRFFTYNAFDQNCQRFIADLLQSNNALSNDAKNFILQDAQSIVKKMPFFVSKIAQFATDTAGRVKQFFGFGSAEPRRGYVTPSKIIKMNKRKLRFQNFIKKLKYREV